MSHANAKAFVTVLNQIDNILISKLVPMLIIDRSVKRDSQRKHTMSTSVEINVPPVLLRGTLWCGQQ